MPAVGRLLNVTVPLPGEEYDVQVGADSSTIVPEPVHIVAYPPRDGPVEGDSDTFTTVTQA